MFQINGDPPNSSRDISVWTTEVDRPWSRVASVAKHVYIVAAGF